MTDERANPTGSDEPQPTGPPSPPAYPYGPPPGAYPLAPPPPYGGYPMQPGPAHAPRNGLGIAALIVAVIGLVLVWSVVGGLIFGVTAVILGFVAHGRARRGEATNGGVAISGAVLGIIACVLSLVFAGIWAYWGVRWFDDVGGNDYVHCLQQAGDDQAAQQRCEDEFQRRVEDSFDVEPTPTR